MQNNEHFSNTVSHVLSQVDTRKNKHLLSLQELIWYKDKSGYCRYYTKEELIE